MPFRQATMSIDQVIWLVSAVAVFSIVQSVFGVGLLLFGTPTLLLTGMAFPLVLTYLLPCSIVVSSLQVASSGGLTLEPIRKRFLAISAPAVLIATVIALRYGSPHAMRTVVGAMLLATALLRLGPMQAQISAFVSRHTRSLMLCLGILHGLSNLGGGILTVIVGSSFEGKAVIRRHIAFAYGVMAIIQLSVVILTKHPQVELPLWAALPVLAGCIYRLLGQRVFLKAGHRPYQFGLTGLIASFGLLLVTTV
jgi:hypothetical protein